MGATRGPCGEFKNVHTMLRGKQKEKRPLGRLMLIIHNNIKTVLKGIRMQPHPEQRSTANWVARLVRNSAPRVSNFVRTMITACLLDCIQYSRLYAFPLLWPYTTHPLTLHFPESPCQPWRWKQHVSPKRSHLPTSAQGVKTRQSIM
jgi:hypothetical protein